jgi:hypothetical protein
MGIVFAGGGGFTIGKSRGWKGGSISRRADARSGCRAHVGRARTAERAAGRTIRNRDRPASGSPLRRARATHGAARRRGSTSVDQRLIGRSRNKRQALIELLLRAVTDEAHP